jgi:hypothetical protein
LVDFCFYTGHLLAACLAAVTFTMEVQLGATGAQPGMTVVSFIGFKYFRSFNVLMWFPSGVLH